MGSRKNEFHTRRVVEGSLRKLFLSPENRQSRLEQEEERAKRGCFLEENKKQSDTVSFENFMEAFFRRCGKFRS